MKKGKKIKSVKMKVAGKPFSLELKKKLQAKSIPFLYPVMAVIALNIILIIFIVLSLDKLPPEVPLYYGLPRGEQQLASPVELILPLAISSVFIGINVMTSLFIKPVYIKNILSVSGVFFSVMAIITVVRIIMVVLGV